MEVSSLGVESELQLLAYTTATATLDPQPTERGQGSNLPPHGYEAGSFPLSHKGKVTLCLLGRGHGTSENLREPNFTPSPPVSLPLRVNPSLKL